MGFNKIISFLFAFIFCGITGAQELPPIQNYSPRDYKAENQNWAISQSSDKLIYIANNKGLLEFNGASWKLYSSPNETIMRSVHVVEDRIYSGSFREFGYWKKNEVGALYYTSLSRQIDVKLLEDEEFWNIIDIDDLVIFQSLKRIYIYSIKDQSVNIIESNNTITKMFKIGQSVYFQRINQGIFKIKYGQDFLVFDDDVIKNNEVINIFKSGNELLILTRDNGFYVSKDNSLVKTNIISNKLLAAVSIYDGIRLKDNSFALGTISHGLIHLNEHGKLIYTIDQNKGLSNNTVLSLFEDVDNNIWLGLDNGIDYINVNSPIKIYNDNKGVLGSVYASAISDGNLYLGTNQGLFYKNFKSSDSFEFVKGTEGQVWCLKVINDKLFCGHNSGTFTIDGNQSRKISNIQGTWVIDRFKDKPNLLIQANYDGIYILENINNTWQVKNKIEGFNNSSRYFENLENEIFVNHEYNGIYKVNVDSAFTKVKNVFIDSIIKGANSGIVKYNGEILYAYKNGIFKYDKGDKKFVRDSLLSSIYTQDEYVSGKLILDQKSNDLWVFTKSNINYVSRGELTTTPKIKKIPLTKEVRNDILGYENVTRLNNQGAYLIGTTSGYLTINIEGLHSKDFQVYIGNVVNGSTKSNKERIVRINKDLDGDFKSSENNLKISFYTPEYSKFIKPQYQFQLLGIYDDWSNWSDNPIALFENLPFGEYTFNVRAKMGNKISGNTASYSFKIAKPWYLTNLMLAIYALIIILFSFFMHFMYKRYYNRKQEELVEKNRREIELAKVQNEKEIIRIKNEQLKQEFKDKSKELAASTIDIAKKNELLTQIKNHLAKVSDQATIRPVIHIIDKNLDHNDNWEFFKEAFNNVDRKFLKKLKKTHPDLSPNDLKLCAYLRLNLSSKEIAPLFNISARSVEIKRYRLRKKLNLQHEENLVNYILEL
ncbi:triple tyrosine motif-containing protein [Aquimarina gracilis]|uniref:Triple tyrosine motif-containing protein n=1 Tax=Aquimarina gracilis TaxID=874422 RepID=A0ABU5ZVW6_9FLAO|nr:triple tyrosine motif-containing protein [Aquimarina gracilis]MEB3346015.1 triple tyrosine motif-containing protein [Aquimarina gracilis]